MPPTAPTFRHVDEPVRLAGLELEDWFACLMIFALGIFTLPLIGFLGDSGGRMLAAGTAIGTGVVLYRIKRGRPAGYLRWWIHQSRLTRLLPSMARPAGTLPAPRPFGANTSIVRAQPSGRGEIKARAVGVPASAPRGAGVRACIECAGIFAGETEFFDHIETVCGALEGACG